MSKRDRGDEELNLVILDKSISELLKPRFPEKELMMKVSHLVAMKAVHLVKNVDSYPEKFDTPNPFLSLNYPKLKDCFRVWDNTIGLARLKTLQPVEQDRFQLDPTREYSEYRKKLTIFSQTVTSLDSNQIFTDADKIDELYLANFDSFPRTQTLSDYTTKFTYSILKQRVTYIIRNLNVLIHLYNPHLDSSRQLQSREFLSETPHLVHTALSRSLVDRLLPPQLQNANGSAVLKLLPHTDILQLHRDKLSAYNELIDAILEFRYFSDKTSSVQFHKLQFLFVKLQKKIIGILKNVTEDWFDYKITFPSDFIQFIKNQHNYYKCFSMIRLISINTDSEPLILFLCKSIFTLLTDAHVERVVKFIYFLTREKQRTYDEMIAGVKGLLLADSRVLYRLLISQFLIPAKNVDHLVKIILPEGDSSGDDDTSEGDSSGDDDTSEGDTSESDTLEGSARGASGGRSNKSKKVKIHKKKINTKRVKRHKKINTKRVKRHKKINTKRVKRHIFRRGQSQCNKKK
jgi:hypothetical protein